MAGMLVMDKRKSLPIWPDRSANGALLLRWAYTGPTTPPPTYVVMIDGQAVATTTAQQCDLSPALEGRRASVSVFALSALEAATLDLSTLAYEPPRGARAQLTVPAVDLEDNPDFSAYQFYWSDDGSDPIELLAEMPGADNNTLITPILTEGTTYKFRARLRDAVGNMSDWGDTVTLVANGDPKPAVDAALAYDQETRTAVITATAPTSQHPDVVGYAVFSNYLPGVGLQAAIAYDQPLAWLQSMAWTSPELFAGHWMFAVCAVDSVGHLSEPVTLDLVLAHDGDALVQTDTPPARPVDIDAVPISGGKVRATVTVDDPAAGRTIRVYRDGALDGEVAQQDGVYTYAFETDALTHGQTYVFTATTFSTIESSPSDQASATADSVPPTGSATITARLID